MTNQVKTKLILEVANTGETIEMIDFRGVVAGYTGRDPVAVQQHIDELAAIGVAPPPSVPMFYPMQSALFDSSGEHSDNETLTSGEIEPVYIRHNGRFYLGIGSDHTDRDLETVDIGGSKQACPKPISRQVIEIDDLESFSLDDAVACTWVDGSIYQVGPLSGLRTPADVVGLLLERTDIGNADFVCLGGTLPLINGEFRRGDNWKMHLEFPDGQEINHGYTMKKEQD